jgi:nitrite reductase (NO-forming)
MTPAQVLFRLLAAATSVAIVAACSGWTSAFHLIGEIWDRVNDQASLTASPLTDVQTTLVPPGGATMVEFKVEVPGTFLLVDHALSRVERGLVGAFVVEGDPNPDVFTERKAEQPVP